MRATQHHRLYDDDPITRLAEKKAWRELCYACESHSEDYTDDPAMAINQGIFLTRSAMRQGRDVYSFNVYVPGEDDIQTRMYFIAKDRAELRKIIGKLPDAPADDPKDDRY